MACAWVIWCIFCGLSLGNASNSVQSDLLTATVPDAVRNGATIFTRFLNPKISPFLSFFFQSLSERIKKLDKIPREEGAGEENGLILIMLRLMGIDSRKASDFAFNGVISLVLLMSKVFLVQDEGRRRKQRGASRDFSMFRFIVSQPQVVSLLVQMQDPDLMDLILKESKINLKNDSEKDLDCIRLLLCRAKPFVWGMQRSLRFFLKREKVEISDDKIFKKKERVPEEACSEPNEDDAWEAANLEDRMYFFAPSMREVVESGDQCDQLFPNCFY